MTQLPEPSLRPSRYWLEWLELAGFSGFLFFFGLGSFGLLGADEPRYAQIAREMLARRDWITPTLYGLPWLEKPALYYWEAMISYRLFGVSDWAARLPSAASATAMVVAVYLVLRRLRPGSQFDAALMTASSAAVIGFARAASPDMPLAAAFTVSMLAWFGWLESSRKGWLAAFYFFLGLGALAKGPVAPVLAVLIILLFAAVRRDLRLATRSLWLPGLILFCAVALPWYLAVQLRNPEFFRVFILQHNLERYATNLYRHPQPFWYYLPVAALGLMPWLVFVVAACADTLRQSRRQGPPAAETGLEVFLLVWLVVPVLFFSLSQSKLPGYILPAAPAGAILLAQYSQRQLRREDASRPHTAVLVLHSAAAALPLVPVLLIQFLLLRWPVPWRQAGGMLVGVAGVVFAGMVATLHNQGLRMLRFVTLVPVVLVLGVFFRIGAPALNTALSARALEHDVEKLQAAGLPLAVFQVSRETQYGLAFYRGHAVDRYDTGQIPSRDHVLVAREGTEAQITRLIPGRRLSHIGSHGAQHLDYYWVSAAPPHPH